MTIRAADTRRIIEHILPVAIVLLLFPLQNISYCQELAEYVRNCSKDLSLTNEIKIANSFPIAKEEGFADSIFRHAIDGYLIENPVDYVVLRDLGRVLRQELSQRIVAVAYISNAKYSEGNDRQEQIKRLLRSFPVLEQSDFLITSVETSEIAVLTLFYEDLSCSTYKMSKSEGGYLFSK